MLTRLTENGNGMCHRYWPEEGSELYHIYEVSHGAVIMTPIETEFTRCEDVVWRPYHILAYHTINR